MNQWYVIYDKKTEAVNSVFATVSKYVTAVCVLKDNLTEEIKENGNLIYVGVKGMIDIPTDGYRIKAYKNDNGGNVIILDGDGDINLTYAAIDFKNKYLVKARENKIGCSIDYVKNAFGDNMPDYDESFTPYIKRRALWSWGYVIYDYKGYIDNMQKLKLNMLIIWNDYPPVNANELVEYAHKKGIKVIWGFSWGWDTSCSTVDVDNLEAISDEVVEKYEKYYAELKGDGIYFQTFTELQCDSIKGRIIADAAVELVNKTADRLFTKYPDLEIQFGLHATSVKNKLEYIKNVDERVLILWEDCGAYPFSNVPSETDTFEETMKFSDEIKNLRNGGFGELFKSMILLDWGSFKHQPGEYIIGEYDESVLEEKLREKQKIWKYIQAYWISNAKYVKTAVERLNHNTLVAALVEDGMFDKKAWYPVALYAEILWNPNRDIQTILTETALMDDVSFA